MGRLSQSRWSSLIVILLCLCVCNFESKATPTTVISDPIARIYTKISIDSIKNLYDPLIQSEAYDELVSKQKKVIELSSKIYEPNSSEIAEENHWLGYFLSQCGKYQDAILCVQTAANIYNSLGSEYLGEYFDVLEKIALYYYGDNNFEGAIKAYCHMLYEFDNKKSIIIEPYIEALGMALRLSQQIHFPITLDKSIEFLSSEHFDDEDKFNLYSDVINYYLDKNNPHKAIEIYELACNIIEKEPEYRSLEKWGDILLNIVNAYSSLGDFDNAIIKLNNAEIVYSGIDNPINAYYVHYSMGNIRHQMYQMQQAFEAYEKAINDINGIEEMNLAKANLLALQARCMLALNERDKASELVEKAINLIDHKNQYATPEIIEIYDVYSSIEYNKGLYKEIIDRLTKVKDSFLMNDSFTQQIDKNIGLAYAKIGDFKNAVLIADNLISKLPQDDRFESLTKDEFEDYLGRVTTIGSIYSLSDRLSDAIHLLKHAYELCELHRFNTGEGYGAMLNNLGLYNSYLGNYEDAKKFSLLSLGFNQSNGNKDYIHIFETLSNLFLISLQTKDEENLQHYAHLSYDAMCKIESINFGEIETYIRNLLSYFVIVDDLERAEAIKSYVEYEAERLYGKGSQRYFEAISQTIYLYEAKCDWNSLISLAESILNNYDDDLHLRRAPIYYSLLNAYIQKGDENGIAESLERTYQHEAAKVQMMASKFDSRERLFLLNNIQNFIISRSCAYLSENSISSNVKNSILESVYNGVLLFKGLNLQIDKNSVKGVKSLQISYMQDVQSKLQQADCAIEFVEFDTDKGHEYGALILTSNGCDFVSIATEKDLLSIPMFDRYENREYSQLIWGAIMPYISDKTTIYFSACGELHNIGLEYLSALTGDGTISDYYNIYRLSSTRLLVDDKKNDETLDIALYGGMVYDESPDNNLSTSSSVSLLINRDDDMAALRGNNYKYLPATLKEVNLIDSIFTHSNLGSTKFIGLNASESSFKSFGDNYPSIIHIATHGVYWDVKSIANDIRWSLIYDSDKMANVKNEEDYALARSVLLFSGAQKYLMENMSVDKGEDGILTALELSKLNLDMVDLVVLSACQTGLGDVKGDGIFGLQRGLKKAGVDSILMSLWEVDDEATRMLMVEFYKNLSKGIAKQESLKIAQRKVRETPGFEDIDNWAAFILLDALN